MSIISYAEYKLLFNKIKMIDQTEYYLQRYVIEQLISSVNPKLDVIDVSVQRYSSKSKKHDKYQYTGSTLPDLLIVKEWNYYNVVNKLDYRAVVEVKTPFTREDGELSEAIDLFEKNIDRIEVLLKGEKNNKVILTNGIQWYFINNHNYANSNSYDIKFILFENNKWINSEVYDELINYLYLFCNQD
ncbi:hypothetical protein [Macrococcus equi]|uniref:hypothetical protein n=1 Tax=Macrococcus equi TaxID=3395462 RepID=UPI0039BE86F6